MQDSTSGSWKRMSFGRGTYYDSIAFLNGTSPRIVTTFLTSRDLPEGRRKRRARPILARREKRAVYRDENDGQWRIICAPLNFPLEAGSVNDEFLLFLMDSQEIGLRFDGARQEISLLCDSRNGSEGNPRQRRVGSGFEERRSILWMAHKNVESRRRLTTFRTIFIFLFSTLESFLLSSKLLG
ncbi:hypothetical protein CDAR_474411 [Caerostris darwini]|uniref:Uncharacterized protein n=1 Tax=Caerostris darwini TaxID=1538125 RepID=A0AAV4M704_9ARAC|nr:hypothetical protein CDAR_474411 [Caerostris darwini]